MNDDLAAHCPECGAKADTMTTERDVESFVLGPSYLADPSEWWRPHTAVTAVRNTYRPCGHVTTKEPLYRR